MAYKTHSENNKQFCLSRDYEELYKLIQIKPRYAFVDKKDQCFASDKSFTVCRSENQTVVITVKFEEIKSKSSQRGIAMFSVYKNGIIDEQDQTCFAEFNEFCKSVDVNWMR